MILKALGAKRRTTLILPETSHVQVVCAQFQKGLSPVSSSTFPVVLVVEDDGRIAETIVLILKKSGFIAFVANSGEEAIQIVSAFTPDWLLSDVVLGGLNGIETAVRIRDLCPGCQMLLMSGNVMTSELLNEARLLGHDFEILAKPFHPTELLAKLVA